MIVFCDLLLILLVIIDEFPMLHMSETSIFHYRKAINSNQLQTSK